HYNYCLALLVFCTTSSESTPCTTTSLHLALQLVCASCTTTSESTPYWHQLRVGGLVVAAVLCVTGIVVLLSGKCKCRSKGRWDMGGT
uniref:FXYD domain-containing ion transport regulator n=1 Tax=Anser cygnoides TaxID=8845 RepID=A0A8B9EB90_ANSCY